MLQAASCPFHSVWNVVTFPTWEGYGPTQESRQHDQSYDSRKLTAWEHVLGNRCYVSASGIRLMITDHQFPHSDVNFSPSSSFLLHFLFSHKMFTGLKIIEKKKNKHRLERGVAQTESGWISNWAESSLEQSWFFLFFLPTWGWRALVWFQVMEGREHERKQRADPHWEQWWQEGGPERIQRDPWRVTYSSPLPNLLLWEVLRCALWNVKSLNFTAQWRRKLVFLCLL